MTIVPLKKITLIGRSSQRDEVLIGLQELGCIHLIDLAGPCPQEQSLDSARSHLHEALRFLESCPGRRQSAIHTNGYEWRSVATESLEIQQKMIELREERESLQRSIDLTRPWGDFNLPPPNQLNELTFWFYRVRHRESEELRNCSLPYQVVSHDAEYQYVVVVAEAASPELPFSAVALDPRPLSELEQRLIKVDSQLESLELQRLALTRWIDLLREDLAASDDEAIRLAAQHRLLFDEELFGLQGWVASASLPKLKKFAQHHALALSVSQPSHRDNPPTLLKNPAAVAGAEGAVTFYMTPGYNTWDPTWVMYVSFSLFFAMIMADAGYGLVLAILLAIFFRKLGHTAAVRRLRNLALFMVIMTIIYGVVIGSYFGASPPSGSLLDRAVWKTDGQSIMNNREAMMFLAAGIGVCHLMLANLILAWQRRDCARALGYLGWAVALVGGMLMAISTVERPSLTAWLAEQVGENTLSIRNLLWNLGSGALAMGLSMVFFFSSERPLFSSHLRDWLWRPLEGLLALTNVSKAFGDALSYLRLFALGLASAQLAVTFNQLAGDVAKVQGIGLLLSVLVFLAGHTLNLMLGVVGGVVHGLRLNCIEFFSWSLTDEGQPFRAFRRKADC